jgi:hypothetical protein
VAGKVDWPGLQLAPRGCHDGWLSITCHNPDVPPAITSPRRDGAWQLSGAGGDIQDRYRRLSRYVLCPCLDATQDTAVAQQQSICPRHIAQILAQFCAILNLPIEELWLEPTGWNVPHARSFWASYWAIMP